MAENKTKATSVSVEEFISKIPDSAIQAEAQELCKIHTEITGFPPVMWGPSIIGFGSCHYKYESGREGDMPLAAFSPRKPKLVIYLSASFESKEMLLNKLGPHSTGKSCLYIKNLTDIDLEVLKQLIINSVNDSKEHFTQN